MLITDNFFNKFYFVVNADRRKEGKFELFYENDEDIIIDQPDDVIVSTKFINI